MDMLTVDRNRQSDDRLQMKTQDSTLMREVMAGAGLTPWEARVVPEVVREIYFTDPDGTPMRDGQIQYQCTALEEGPGKRLDECRLVQVRLTLLDVLVDIPARREHGHQACRRQVLCRITEEAREQGGLLTQEDAAILLQASERTIRRDVKELLGHGIHVATRGYVRDIGPTVSHKGIAIQHWFAGEEPVAIARRINHSLKAVERYLHDFRRVAWCAMQGFDATTTARMVRLSTSLVTTYRTIWATYQDEPTYAYRRDEITLNDAMVDTVAATQNAESSAKKGDPLDRATTPCPSLSAIPTKRRGVRS